MKRAPMRSGAFRIRSLASIRIPKEVMGIKTDPIPKTHYKGGAPPVEEPYSDSEIETLLWESGLTPKLLNSLQELLAWRRKGREVRESLIGDTTRWEDEALIHVEPKEELQVVLSGEARKLCIRVDAPCNVLLKGK